MSGTEQHLQNSLELLRQRLNLPTSAVCAIVGAPGPPTDPTSVARHLRRHGIEPVVPGAGRREARWSWRDVVEVYGLQALIEGDAA